MQTLKVEKANDLNLSMLTNDFFIEILSLIIQKKRTMQPWRVLVLIQVTLSFGCEV